MVNFDKLQQENKPLHFAWREMMKASYGETWEAQLTLSQQADMKRAFMAGALVCMNAWLMPVINAEMIAAMNVEFDKFVKQAHDDVLTLKED